MSLVRALLPSLSLLLIVLIAALPWGVPQDARFAMPMIALTVIHHWAVRSPAALPPFMVFLAGIVSDVLSEGPLGFWPLLYIAGQWLSPYLTPESGRSKVAGLWLGFALTLVVVLGIGWVAACAYFVSAIELRPLAVALPVVLAAEIVVTPLLPSPVRRDRQMPGRRLLKGS